MTSGWRTTGSRTGLGTSAVRTTAWGDVAKRDGTHHCRKAEISLYANDRCPEDGHGERHVAHRNQWPSPCRLEMRSSRADDRRRKELHGQDEHRSTHVGVAGVAHLDHRQQDQNQADTEGETQRQAVSEDLAFAIGGLGDLPSRHRRHPEICEDGEQRDDSHGQRESAKALQPEVARGEGSGTDAGDNP